MIKVTWFHYGMTNFFAAMFFALAYMGKIDGIPHDGLNGVLALVLACGHGILFVSSPFRSKS